MTSQTHGSWPKFSDKPITSSFLMVKSLFLMVKSPYFFSHPPVYDPFPHRISVPKVQEDTPRGGTETSVSCAFPRCRFFDRTHQMEKGGDWWTEGEICVCVCGGFLKSGYL